MQNHPNVIAAALCIEAGQIANSLIFDADSEPLLVLTSGAHRVDTGKVDTALGGFDVVWAAGGVPQAVFAITFPELVRVTSGTPTDVA